MSDTAHFVRELETYVATRLAALDLLKETDPQPAGRSEVVQRLKMALRSELEASELAASWIPSTAEVDVKLGLARQAGDEAKHYRAIEKHLEGMGVDLSGFNPAAEGYGPMFQLLTNLKTTVERVAAAQLTRESLALKKNEQFIQFCEAAGDHDTARLYREHIQPDEAWHVRLGSQILEKYATTPELQTQARSAVDAVLELSVRIQNKQLKEMKISHAPGC